MVTVIRRAGQIGGAARQVTTARVWWQPGSEPASCVLVTDRRVGDAQTTDGDGEAASRVSAGPAVWAACWAAARTPASGLPGQG
jgi:hypothetical protein